jgi:hypothetical protein
MSIKNNVRAPKPVAVSAHAASASHWAAGPGYGISFRDTGNPKGHGIFIGYAGYNVTGAQARTWVDALYKADLKRLGVRYIYAVQGPRDPGYDGLEIGNSHLAKKVVGQAKTAPYVLIAAHSSGSFVADELLHQLNSGADPRGVTRNKVVYFDLDGGQKGVTAGDINRTRRTYYVSAHDHRTGTRSPNYSTMQALGGEFRSKGGFIDDDVTSAGNAAGAEWALHTSLITSRPHSPFTGSPIDYGDFSGGRTPNHWWLDARVRAAGL